MTLPARLRFGSCFDFKPHPCPCGWVKSFREMSVVPHQDMEDDSLLQHPRSALSAGKACRNKSGLAVNLSCYGVFPKSRSPPH